MVPNILTYAPIYGLWILNFLKTKKLASTSYSQFMKTEMVSNIINQFFFMNQFLKTRDRNWILKN